jgi:poly(3-hydroxybutyrate) depolymerase
MPHFSRLLWFFAFSALFLGLNCTKKDEPQNQPRERSGVLEFNAGENFGGKSIPVHYFIPAGDIKSMKFQIVMHGVDRNARDYLAGWAQKARNYKVIVIAPEFRSNDFNTSQYNEGNFMVNSVVQPAEKTTFSLIDKIFEQIKAEFSLEQTTYNIYGHSAGAQFVHRFMQFYESPYVDRAVAANAGWYTFPDPNVSFPYGIRNLFNNNEAHQRLYCAKKLFILLGTSDTQRDNNLRTTQQADAQGRNRLERGESFFAFNESIATALNSDFNWTKLLVEDVAHEHLKMSAAAADLLYQ